MKVYKSDLALLSHCLRSTAVCVQMILLLLIIKIIIIAKSTFVFEWKGLACSEKEKAWCVLTQSRWKSIVFTPESHQNKGVKLLFSIFGLFLLLSEDVTQLDVVLYEFVVSCYCSVDWIYVCMTAEADSLHSKYTESIGATCELIVQTHKVKSWMSPV